VNKKLYVNIFVLLLGALAGGFLGLAVLNLSGVPPAELLLTLLVSAGFTALGVVSVYAILARRLAYQQTFKLTTALEVNKTKDEFISMVLHHLRTPLSGLKWSFKEILKEPEVTGQHRSDLERLHEENNRALNAVEHLIEASQASMERITYHFEVISVEDLLRVIKGSIEQMEARIRAKKISLMVEMPPVSENSIKIDREKISTVVQTLLDNAIAYTNEGGEIKIHTEEKQSNFFLYISDSGMGILEKDKKRIFMQFFRSENARRKEPGGFGIGLFIAKAFIKHHNGKIWFVSKKGGGTTFSFKLPVIESPTEKLLENL